MQSTVCAVGRFLKNTLGFGCAIVASALLQSNPGHAHPGALDANGCHYDSATGEYHCHQEVAPNPDTRAKVKKSRDNICHDASSPNYTTLKFFVSYRSMKACLKSGGRAVSK